MAWKTRLDTMAQLAIVVSLIAILWNVRLTYNAYQDANNGNRVIAALNLLGRYRSDPLVDSTLLLAEAYDSPDATKLIKKQEDQHWDSWEKATLDFNNTQLKKKDIELVTYFFNDVYICLVQKLCDLQLMNAMFPRDVETLYVMSKSYLENVNNDEKKQLNYCGLKALYDALPSGPSDEASFKFDEEKLKKAACPGS